MSTAVALHAAGIVEVVGESYRQDVLQRLAAQATTADAFLDELSGYARERAEDAPEGRWFRAELVREPSNPADPRAVAVHAAGVGQIGYLRRNVARTYAPVFAALETLGSSVGTCPAFLIGGEAEKGYGALLCLSAPDVVVRDLTLR
jgi:HIRAN domain-containing protein